MPTKYFRLTTTKTIKVKGWDDDENSYEDVKAYVNTELDDDDLEIEEISLEDVKNTEFKVPDYDVDAREDF